jgi:hypothetical protein
LALSEQSKKIPRKRVIFIPVRPKVEMLKLALLGTGLSILAFGGVGITSKGWTAFTWWPLIFFCTVFLLYTINLYVLQRPLVNASLLGVVAGFASPPVLVPLAGYILLSFDESLEVTLFVLAPVSAVILLLGVLEASHLNQQKMKSAFLKNKHLRNLPNGMLAYDHYWESAWAKDAKVPGFGWRKWFDGTVLVLAILAMPIGAAAAFTSKGNIFNIPDQWGMATTALTIALVLRNSVTAFLGQLTFVRYLERVSK